jgi:predicted transcriptional regulator
MTEEQIVSWIFLAIALATSTEPSDINGISMVADGINHAVPTQKELQISIAWLTNKGLILKNGKRYELTNKGKLEYEAVSKNSDKLLAIWKNLETKLGNYEK